MKTPSSPTAPVCCSVLPHIKKYAASSFRCLPALLLFAIANAHSQTALPSGGSEPVWSTGSSITFSSGGGGGSTGGILPDAPPLGANNFGANFSDALLNNGYKDAAGNNVYPYIFPPDTHAAVGPNHMVAVVNGVLVIHEISTSNVVGNFRLGRLSGTGNPSTVITDANGNVLVPANTTSAFFAPLAPANRLFDPRVVYDQFQQRFVVIALERVLPPSPTVSRILIAVSPGSDPTVANWYFRAVDAKETVTANGTTTEYFADYPTAAIDNEALYITVNMFPFGGSAFLGNRVWIVNKSQLYAAAMAGTAAALSYRPFALAGVPAEGNVGSAPAHVFGANGVLNGKGTYLVGWANADTGGQNRLSVIRISNPLTTPVFTHRYVNLGSIHDNAFTSSENFPDAPQLSDTLAAHQIDTGDDHWSIYMANTIVPRSAASGQPANPDQGEATAHWYQVDTTTFDTAATGLPVEQQGNIGGEELGAATHTFRPYLAVDSAGNIGLGLSASGANINAGAYYTGRKFAAAANTMQSLGEFARGVTGYFRPDQNARNRWGDYSSVTLDPDDESTFWMYNEFADTQGNANANDATANGRWATKWGSFSVRDATLKNDLNGDGFPDLLFQFYDTVNTANAANGNLACWFMNGVNRIVNTPLTPNVVPNSNWVLSAVGDFNGDKKTDFVFKVNTANVIRFWFMNGSKRTVVAAPTPDIAISQVIRAAADFDGDTKLDLVLQSPANGRIFTFRFGSVIINGATQSVPYLGNSEITPPAGTLYPSTSLRACGAADFNGDGKPDLVIQNITAAGAGALSVWYMNNTVATGSDVIPAGNQITTVNDALRGLDDISGDGQPDLIIQNGATISMKPRIGTTGFNFGPKQFFNPNSPGSPYWTIRNN